MKYYVAANNNYMALSAFKIGKGIRSLKQCVASRTGRQHIYSMEIKRAFEANELIFIASRPLPTESQSGGTQLPSPRSTLRHSTSYGLTSAALDNIAKEESLDPVALRSGILQDISALTQDEHYRAQQSERAYIDTPRGRRSLLPQPFKQVKDQLDKAIAANRKHLRK